MARVDLLTDGRLIELLTEDALNHDPTRDLVHIRRPGVLAEVARRVAERQRRKEARSTPGP